MCVCAVFAACIRMCILLFKYNVILSASVGPLSLVDYSRMCALAPSFSLNVHRAAAISETEYPHIGQNAT